MDASTLFELVPDIELFTPLLTAGLDYQATVVGTWAYDLKKSDPNRRSRVTHRRPELPRQHCDALYSADHDGNFTHAHYDNGSIYARESGDTRFFNAPRPGLFIDLNYAYRGDIVEEDRQLHRYTFSLRGQGKKKSIVFLLPHNRENVGGNMTVQITACEPKPPAKENLPSSTAKPKVSSLDEKILRITKEYEEKTAIAEAIIKAQLAGNARLTKLLDEQNLSPIEKRKIQDMVAAILNEGGKDNGPIRKL